MKTKISKMGVVLLALAAALLIAGTASVRAEDKAEAQALVDRGMITLNSFMGDENYTWLRENLKNAKGVLIYPQVLKAGFILGGSGGDGILLVRDEKSGAWSQPAFYSVGAMSFGLQIGGETAETIILVMTPKAVDSLFSSSVKLGADSSVAFGPAGGGGKANVAADFLAFSKSKGLYAGLNLEGSVVDVRESLNRAYYGQAVSPVQIIVENEVKNEGSSRLRAALKAISK